MFLIFNFQLSIIHPHFGHLSSSFWTCVYIVFKELRGVLKLPSDTTANHFGHSVAFPQLRETVSEHTVFHFPSVLSVPSVSSVSSVPSVPCFAHAACPPLVSFGGGMQGGTLNCQGFPCKQKIVSLTRHRRLAGRDPTARRWSPERRNQECRCGERRSQVFLHSLHSLHSLHVLHGEVYLSFLSVLCVLCGKTVLAFFREFSCFSWLRCIFWLRLCRAKSSVVKMAVLCG